MRRREWVSVAVGVLVALNACGGAKFKTTGDDGGNAGSDPSGGGGMSATSGRGGMSATSGRGGTTSMTGRGGMSATSGRGGTSSMNGRGGTSATSGGTAEASGGDSAGGMSQAGAAGADNSGGSSVESGGSSAGGTMSGNGGQSSGGDSGGSLGGVLGQGGSGGLIAMAGASGRSFPTTKVLDQFERDDGAVGANWVSALDEYEIKDKALHHLTSTAPTLLWSTKFAMQQEAFAKLVDFGDMAKEINLVVLAQEPNGACDYIELIYKPVLQELAVDYCFEGEWRGVGTFAMALEKGDELGARIAADRRLLAYVNRKLVTTFDISAYPMVDGGYIGVNSYENEQATWDDFGGGNVR